MTKLQLADARDVLIVGGGPSGLSAALVLGRCGRRVELFDDGRGGHGLQLHGYLGVADQSSAHLRALGLQQLRAFEHVGVHFGTIKSVRRHPGGFDVFLESGDRHQGRKLLLALGATDGMPSWSGAAEHYGRGIYRSPYCNAWEHRGQPIAVLGNGAKAFSMALEMTQWSPHVVLCSDGPLKLSQLARARLRRHKVPVVKERIVAVEGNNEQLTRIVFESGSSRDCAALFLSTRQEQRMELAQQLGCAVNDRGLILSDRRGSTSVSGVFVASDVDGSLTAEMAIIAAAEGARAAQAISQELFRDRLEARRADGSKAFR